MPWGRKCSAFSTAPFQQGRERKLGLHTGSGQDELENLSTKERAARGWVGVGVAKTDDWVLGTKVASYLGKVGKGRAEKLGHREQPGTPSLREFSGQRGRSGHCARTEVLLTEPALGGRRQVRSAQRGGADRADPPSPAGGVQGRGGASAPGPPPLGIN